MLRKIASNATANIAGGGVIAIFQFGMTSAVARLYSTYEVTIWAIAASLASFAPLLSCNLSVTVARKLSTVSDMEGGYGIVLKAANSVARYLTTVGLLLAGLLLILIPHVYSELAQENDWSFVLVAIVWFIGGCWVIPAQPSQGYLLFEQRNWRITFVNLVVRGSSILAFLIISKTFPMSYGIAISVSAGLLWIGPWLMARGMPAYETIDKKYWKLQRLEIVRVSWGFGVWNLTSAATQTATIPTIALIASELVNPVFFAFTIVSTLASGLTAVANSLIAPLAVFVNNRNVDSAIRMVIQSTVVLWSIYSIATLTIFIFLDPLMRLWVGNEIFDGVNNHVCFILLALQYSLRSLGLTSSISIAVSAPARVLALSPLAEAFAIATIALPLAFFVGPIAFLLGLCIAGLVGTFGTTYFAYKYTHDSRAKKVIWLTSILSVITISMWGIVALIYFL
jgi:hypothetical protein